MLSISVQIILKRLRKDRNERTTSEYTCKTIWRNNALALFRWHLQISNKSAEKNFYLCVIWSLFSASYFHRVINSLNAYEYFGYCLHVFWYFKYFLHIRLSQNSTRYIPNDDDKSLLRVMRSHSIACNVSPYCYAAIGVRSEKRSSILRARKSSFAPTQRRLYRFSCWSGVLQTEMWHNVI